MASGEADAPLAVSPLQGGGVELRSVRTGVALQFTPKEWKAFVAGVRDGEFVPSLAAQNPSEPEDI